MFNISHSFASTALIASLMLSLTSCSKEQEMPAQLPQQAGMDEAPIVHAPSEHIAYFISNDRANLGKVTLTQTDTGITARVEIDGIPAGDHGMHFHQIGDCSDAEFKASGGHINPDKLQHGLKNAHGPDNADLPNLRADETGKADQTVTNDRLSFYGEGGRPALFDENGSAMVIHANPDDHITQPIGGAGARIACAVIATEAEE